ncbi:MAG: DUF624 domain-containing protein [Lachnospiraceae bacterium]|nr:DUF624 domain-containing protein [Lachnospiraceae bacterium]
MKLFSFDSPVMQAISKATDYALLNILWIICSLPVFTAGAAFSAKYYVGMKMGRGEEPAVFQSFFKSFASNLKQTILPSIVVFLIAAFFVFDWYMVIKAQAPDAYKWILFVVSMIFMMVVFCFFPIIARYEITTGEAVRTALGLAAARFPRVFLAIICFILPFIIGIWYFKWAWLICLGAQTVMLYYNSAFFVKEFDKLEAKLFGEKPADEGVKESEKDAAWAMFRDAAGNGPGETEDAETNTEESDTTETEIAEKDLMETTNDDSVKEE